MGRRVTGELRALSSADLGEIAATEKEQDFDLPLEFKKLYLQTAGRIPQDIIIRHSLSSDQAIFGEQPAAQQESHTRDSYNLAKDALEELKLPMLKHDIGKAGPDPENQTLTQLIATMYAYNFPYRERKTSPTRVPLSEFLEAMSTWIYREKNAEETFGPQDEFVATSMEMLSDIPATSEELSEPSVRDFYDYHVQWGVQLNEKYAFMDEESAFAAFGHHILPSRLFRAEDGTPFVEKTRVAKIPVIKYLEPTITDIQLAAGAQALDYCNAVFTRRTEKENAQIKSGQKEAATGRLANRLSDAALETQKTLFFGIDNDGYETLIEEYAKEGVEISISDKDKNTIKDYIKHVLQNYTKKMLSKHA